ncbi:RnfH family protein [Celerinatantimonas sp. MCCC 1A17872]
MSELNIEVVYALPEKQTLLSEIVDEGTTIEQAIAQSGIFQHHPELKGQALQVGIFSRAAKLTDQVQDGDRIEIYRPLLADPKELRKLRAQRAKNSGKADKVTGGRPNPLRHHDS